MLKSLLVCSFSLLALGSNYPRVDADLKNYDDAIAAKKAAHVEVADPHDREGAKNQLAHMFDIDQYTRLYWLEVPTKHGYSEEEKKEFGNQFLRRFRAVDAQNTSDLKGMLQIHGWFKISVFGEEADNNAWLLVQHADQEPVFQKEILLVLERLYPFGETSPKNYAYLWDRVAASYSDLSKRVPQRYGTQGICTGPGQWDALPIEEPVAELDQRRATVGLGPAAEHMEITKKFCH